MTNSVGGEVVPIAHASAIRERRRAYGLERSRRARSVRKRTLNLRRMAGAVWRESALYPDVEGIERPRTRGDCVRGVRPCPFVGCSHHLYADVHPRTGNLTLNFPDLAPDELKDSCSLDLADRGRKTLGATARAMNLSRARVAQIEELALDKLAGDPRVRHLLPGPSRRLRIIVSQPEPRSWRKTS
jgi:hypothetical protein